MSGSWSENGRKLINDVKETLRMQFGQTNAYSWSIRIETSSRVLNTDTRADIFGGVLIQDEADIVYYDIRPDCESFPLATHWDTVIQTDTIQLEPPITVTEKMLEPSDCHLQSPPLLGPLKRVQRLLNEPFYYPKMKSLNREGLRLARLSVARYLNMPQWGKPVSNKIPLLKSKAVKATLSGKQLPINLKPVAVYRFSQSVRQQFKATLAEKAKVKVTEVQVTQVYDRVPLACLQSLNQTDEGLLQCVSKPYSECKNAGNNPVYLIKGKLLKQPGSQFQAILPMSALQETEPKA